MNIEIVKYKLKGFALIASVFTLAIILFNPIMLLNNFSKNLALFLIITCGLFHGCNDLQLHVLNKVLKRIGFIWRLLLYVVIGALTFTFAMFYPKLGLAFFVVISAYHFGEEQLSSYLDGSKLWHFIQYAIGGMFIFAILFYFNYTEVDLIFKETGIGLWQRGILGMIAVCCFLVQFIVLISLTNIGQMKLINFLKIQFELLLVTFLFTMLDLLMGFTLYFIFWHSLPSLAEQMMKLNALKENKSDIAFHSLSVYGISIFFISIFLLYLDHHNFKFYIALGVAVTMPHVMSIVISKNYKLK